MDYRKFTIYLDRDTRKKLTMMARAEGRTPEQQVIWLLRRELSLTEGVKVDTMPQREAVQQTGAIRRATAG